MSTPTAPGAEVGEADPFAGPLVSPVDVVDPAEIDRLFALDPLLLTDADLDKMIAFYRAKREQWAHDESTAATRPKRTLRPRGPSADSVKAALGGLSLDDLEAM